MTDRPTDPTGPPGSVRARAQPDAASAPPGGTSAPGEVTATVVPRRETTAERSRPRSRERARSTGSAAATSVASASVADRAGVPTKASRPARSVAAATTSVPPAPAPTIRPTGDAPPHPGPDRRGRPALRPGQVVCWQLAAALVATSAGRAAWVIGAAVVGGFALVALTATWHRDLWTYQRALLGLGQLARDSRFVPVEAIHRTIEIGGTEAAVLVRPSGITVLLEVDDPTAPPDPATLPEPPAELETKLLRQRDRTWVALTAGRTVGRHTDVELELLLANAVRRLIGSPRQAGASYRGLSPRELAEVLARFAPERAREEWNGLALWTGHYRMYAAPLDLAHPPAGAVMMTRPGTPPGVRSRTPPGELGYALVLAPAGAPPEAGCVPLTGRQRSAFLSALP